MSHRSDCNLLPQSTAVLVLGNLKVETDCHDLNTPIVAPPSPSPSSLFSCKVELPNLLIKFCIAGDQHDLQGAVWRAGLPVLQPLRPDHWICARRHDRGGGQPCADDEGQHCKQTRWGAESALMGRGNFTIQPAPGC